MRYTMCSGFIIWIICLCVCTSCTVEQPVLMESGQVVGGHPKLNKILQRIIENRNEYVLRADGAISAIYIVTLDPTVMPVATKGDIPATPTNPSAEYSLIASSSTLDVCTIAFVTKAVLYQRNGTPCMEADNVMYDWNEGDWQGGDYTATFNIHSSPENLETFKNRMR